MLHHECRHEAVPLPSPQEDITSAPRDLTIIARPPPNTAYAAEDTKSGYLTPSLRKPTRLLKLNYHPHLCQHARPSPMSGPLRTRPRCSPLPIPASHRFFFWSQTQKMVACDHFCATKNCLRPRQCDEKFFCDQICATIKKNATISMRVKNRL